MISELTHETTDQLSNLLSRRWNERLVHAGIGDLASPIYKQQIIMINPNKRWEEYML
jgi:ABC-type Fe3+ transport system substrate-binding protein